MKKFIALAALAATSLTSRVIAQDEAAAPAPNPKDLLPRAAEIAPLASKTLLLGIAAAGNTLVAVGDRGIILTSTDGSTWTQVASPVHATLTAISFADEKNGWAVGHDTTVLHTADGGQSWEKQVYVPADHKPLLSVLALDAQRALAVGAYGSFIGTQDGGKTWAPVDAPALLEDGLHLNSIVKLGDGTLFITGETGLTATSADGKAWKRGKLPYEGSMFGALARGARGAIVFGLRGNVFATDDVNSGKWTRIDTQTTMSMFGGVTLPDGSVVLAGADGEVLYLGKAGGVTKGRAGAKDTRSLGSGTLSAVIAWKDGLLVAGETGVSPAAVK